MLCPSQGLCEHWSKNLRSPGAKVPGPDLIYNRLTTKTISQSLESMNRIMNERMNERMKRRDKKRKEKKSKAKKLKEKL